MLSLLFPHSFLFLYFPPLPFPNPKCCIQLAKPGKLPLVSVNQEKNSGTHILMITELGKKHCFLSHQYLLLFVVGVSDYHQLVYFTGCSRTATPWHCFECVLFVALVGIDCLVLAFLNDFFPHTASVNLWSHPSDLAVVSKASLLCFISFSLGFFFFFPPCPPAPPPTFSLLFLFQHTVSLTDMSLQLSEEVKGEI